MNHLQLFEGFNDQDDSMTMKKFKEKYSQYIKSGDIKMKKDIYAEIQFKKNLNLPELRKDILDMLFTKEDDVNGYESYYTTIPLKMDFGDIISFDMKHLKELLGMSPDDIKKYLQSRYDNIVNDPQRIRTLKKREIWGDENI